MQDTLAGVMGRTVTGFAPSGRLFPFTLRFNVSYFLAFKTPFSGIVDNCGFLVHEDRKFSNVVVRWERDWWCGTRSDREGEVLEEMI